MDKRSFKAFFFVRGIEFSFEYSKSISSDRGLEKAGPSIK